MNPKYEQAAREYKPNKIKILFICESPPAPKKGHHNYFYFENCFGSEPLFSTIIKAICREDYRKGKSNKIELLKKFARYGYFLIDACEYPINQMKHKKRRKIIRKKFPKLVKKIKSLANPNMKIILIQVKATGTYDFLFDELKNSGFRVINEEQICFPRYCGDRKVVKKIRRLI